jgi:excisionase family DNA binding protein
MRDAIADDAPIRPVYTPETLAQRWDCSAKHVRNLIAREELQGFRIGGKLLRISAKAVREFEQCSGQLESTEAGLPSSTTETESATVTRLGPLTRARLRR